ncbi:unnamed protein product [Pseudo-nitzschia multistriata]|uniref:Uncharacterized protein n=1 Tax=Pseudo-nitzschia multistriata TaxID=183589 RepID=A0A448YWT7_9STRA|nr:unnamed protein product [Pseudo-nitzschia multistriata]
MPAISPPAPSDGGSFEKPLSLKGAMEAADRVRKFLLEQKDPAETEQWFPPGTWQGAAAFAATGLLMTPLRGSLLSAAGPRGPFQGFVDLVVTPILAVGAAQAGLVIGTLYGSSHYLERVAMDAATNTNATFSEYGTGKIVSVRQSQDGKLSFSPTTADSVAQRERSVAHLCQQVLLPFPSSTEDSLRTRSSQQMSTDVAQHFSFGSWDPRTKTMESLIRAVNNCRQREH